MTHSFYPHYCYVLELCFLLQGEYDVTIAGPALVLSTVVWLKIQCLALAIVD